MAARWLRAGVASALLVACVSHRTENQSGPSTTSSEPEPKCVEGTTCACELPGQKGTVACDATGRRCECEACEPFQTKDTPSVTSCDGAPVGTWRLMEARWGTAQLHVGDETGTKGACDLNYTPLSDEPPRMLMRLHEGGKAEYFSESTPMRVAYEETCATDKSSVATCGAAGGTNCSLDCNVCSCDATVTGVDIPDGNWSRTSEVIALGVFEKAPRFTYCATDDKLELSALGLYLAFERVVELSKPAPCSDRLPDECAVSESSTCSLGACVGADKCVAADLEGDCLTLQGCQWREDRCRGESQVGCALAEYGVVPGCELTNRPVACEGTPEPCDGRSYAACLGGCTMNEKGRCTGTLQCEKFLVCPISGCEPEPDFVKCKPGKFSCANMGLESTCNDVVKTYDADVACSWDSSFCEGAPSTCADLPAEQCDLVPGCRLVEQ
jgi:hypothetical protein